MLSLKRRFVSLTTSEQFAVLVLTIGAALWIWSGWSTWHDLMGKPNGAPFLMIPGHLRSVCFWWIPALVAIWSAWTGKARVTAFFLLSLGSVVRFISYLVSWVTSWSWVDAHVPDEDLKGDPLAWGSAWIYAALLLGLIGFFAAITTMQRMERKIAKLTCENAKLRFQMSRQEGQ